MLPFVFLQAFRDSVTITKRLPFAVSNKSDQVGVLQTNNMHLELCASVDVSDGLHSLRVSPATAKAKAKFVLATDWHDLDAWVAGS